jgi:hypothetical protein
VSGDKVSKRAGGNLVDSSQIEAGRDISVGGTFAGRDIKKAGTPGRSKNILAAGLLVLCIATALIGLLALIGVLIGKLDKGSGIRIIEILWGSSLLSGLARAFVKN